MIAVDFPVIHAAVRERVRIQPTAIIQDVVARNEGGFLMGIDTRNVGKSVSNVEGIILDKNVIGRPFDLGSLHGERIAMVVPHNLCDHLIVLGCHGVMVDDTVEKPCRRVIPEVGERVRIRSEVVCS